MRWRKKKRVALALGAGGARGIAHIGVLRALEEERIPIDCIVGSSFGAIVGAIYSISMDSRKVETRIRNYIRSPSFKDTMDEIESIENETSRGFLERIHSSLKRGYFYTRALSRKSILTPETFVKNMKILIGDESFKDMHIPFKCLSVDLITGNPIGLDEGDLSLALQASSATPGFFPPVRLNNMLLVDGGVAEMVPLYLARTFNPDYVVGVDVTRDILPIQDPDEEISHSLDIVFRCYDISRDFMNIYESREVDCIIRPDIGSYSWTDFELFDTFVREGYLAARRKMRVLKKDIYWTC